MLALPKPEEKSSVVEKVVHETSQKLKAIGAGLEVFLKSVEKIVFSPTPTHVPDQKLIDEVVRLLTGEQTTKSD